MTYKYMTPRQMMDYFKQGLFKETLIGKGKFLMIDGHDGDGHTRHYILDRIIDFATKENISKIEQAIYDTIDELIKDDDLEALMRFSWVFLLDLDGEYESTKKFVEIFNYDPNFLSEKLYNYLITKSDVFVKDEQKRKLMLLICSKLPPLAKKMGFGEIEIKEITYKNGVSDIAEIIAHPATSDS